MKPSSTAKASLRLTRLQTRHFRNREQTTFLSDIWNGLTVSIGKQKRPPVFFRWWPTSVKVKKGRYFDCRIWGARHSENAFELLQCEVES